MTAGSWSVAAAVVVFTTSLFAPSASASDDTAADSVSVLFSVTGDDVTLKALKGTRDHLVVISDPDSRVTWFTDRPIRDAGSIALGSFVESWGNVGFGQDPPNAAIQLIRSEEQATWTATMIAPRLRDDGALVFRASPLEDQKPWRSAESAVVFVDPAAVPAAPSTSDDEDGTREGATWPLPKFNYTINECIRIRLEAGAAQDQSPCRIFGN